jgi:hypothetical protein
VCHHKITLAYDGLIYMLRSEKDLFDSLMLSSRWEKTGRDDDFAILNEHPISKPT